MWFLLLATPRFSSHCEDFMNTAQNKDIVAIRYIGKKKRYVDRLYGTMAEWLPGDIVFVPSSVAKKMRGHTDVYEVVDADITDGSNVVSVGEVIENPVVEVENQQKIPSVMPNLANMGKEELVAYAQRHLSERLPRTMKEETMRDKIIGLIQSGRFME